MVEDGKPTEHSTCTENNDIYSLFEGALDKMQDVGYYDDFKSSMCAIYTGYLDHNIVLYLALDVGKYYATPEIR